MESLVRRRYWWFGISLLFILPGLYFLLLHPLVTTGRAEWGLRASIDFSGGALWELRFPGLAAGELSTQELAQAYSQAGFPGALVQLSQAEVEGSEIAAAIVRTEALDSVNPNAQIDRVEDALTATFGEFTRERLETVGPTVSSESTFWAIISVIGASVVILLYLTYAFRKVSHPFRYGMCAIISMLHDGLILVGAAAILGVFIGLEVDALFLTALLTTLSFSAHDTIVVFDRIRENQLDYPEDNFETIVNLSLVQTLPRSINTQLTTMFTMTALLLFGGESIRNFILILLIGMISGTYSSVFTAAQALVVWENQEWKRWFRRGEEEPAPVS